MQDAGWTRHGTHKLEGIRAGLESRRVCEQQMHDEITESVLSLPQHPESWKFESLVGQSESGDCFSPDRKKEWVEIYSEDAGYHRRIIGERIRIDTGWSDAKLCHFLQRPRTGQKVWRAP